MRKLLTATLLGTSFALAACGDSYSEEEGEAYDDTAATADTGYTAPAPEPTEPGPEPTGTDTPEPTDTPTAEPAPADDS
jgi:hypothetical protein